MNTDLIANRTVGQFPLSIGTSLAIESALGIHPEIIVKSPPLLKYDEFYINIRTLFRNIFGSLDRDNAFKATPRQLATALDEEMTMIEEIVKEKINSTVRVIYYYSNYNNLETIFKHSVIRMDNTEKQKLYTKIHNETIKILLDEHKEKKNHNLLVYNLLVKPHTQSPKKTLILTNYLLDLLKHSEFGHLSLLESHTGTIKGMSQWYTKFYKIEGQDLSQIPLNSCLLTIFGDKETFSPFQMKTRLNVLEIAKKYKWSSVSTYDKINYGLITLQNPYEKEIILSMLSRQM